MKHVVAKPAVCEPLKIRRLDWSAKNRRGTESHVVRQDEQDIGRTGRCFDALGKIRRRILHCPADLAFEWRFRFGQNFLGERAKREDKRDRETNGEKSFFHNRSDYRCVAAFPVPLQRGAMRRWQILPNAAEGQTS